MRNEESDKEIDRQIREFTPLPLGQIRETLTVCMDFPTPAGWVMVDAKWSATECTRPSDGNARNLKLLERYDNLPVNSELAVCLAEVVPDGWITVGTYWDPSRCFAPPNPDFRNVKRIRRIK